MTDPDEPTKKPRPTFEAAIEAVCRRYDYTDWAVIARKDNRSAAGWWDAGDGKDVIGDHERMLLLHARLGVLQKTILDAVMAPRPI